MNITTLLARRADERPSSLAIVDAHRTITFAELERESQAIAAALAADGLLPGDVVLLLAPMSVPLYITLLAVLRLGMVAMFVDPSAGLAQIDRCCALVRPLAFLGTWRAHVYRLLSPAIRRIAMHRRIPARASKSREAIGIAPRDSSDAAVVTFTTGSTGAPKAAVRSHGFLLAQHRAVSETLGLRPGDVDLSTLPMFVLANLASGVTSVIPDADLRRPGSIDPAPVLRQIGRYRPTRTVASPAFLDRLAAACVERGETIDSLTRVFTGGGPVFPRTLDRLAAVAPHARIAAVYGSTEAEPIAVMDREDVGPDERRAMGLGGGLLTGRPVASVQAGILPDRWSERVGPFTAAEFTRMLLPPGEAGEIVVSGDHVLAGYLDGRGDAENKFDVDGTRWHRTGDAGYVDASGRLWLLGRSAAALDDGRGRVYPLSIEAAAQACAGVARAALVGCEGRRILAVELIDGGGSHVRATLEGALGWASLDEIRIVSRIPVDGRHNAKVDYTRLRATLSGSWPRAQTAR